MTTTKMGKQQQKRLAEGLVGLLAKGTGTDLLGLSNEVVAAGRLWKDGDETVEAIADALTKAGLERLARERRGHQRAIGLRDGGLIYRALPGLHVRQARDGWVMGRIGAWEFEAKIYEEGSEHGIGGGRVSKLWVGTRGQGPDVANYDRGWDVRPANADAEMAVNTVLEAFA